MADAVQEVVGVDLVAFERHGACHHAAAAAFARPLPSPSQNGGNVGCL